MADTQYSAVTKLGLSILTFNSALAMYSSWGDVGSVAFVLVALVLLFICLRGGGINMHGQYNALAKVGIAVLTCNTALDTYNARRDPGSATLVAVSYIFLVILTGLFLRVFAGAHAAPAAGGFWSFFPN